jgi:hypothetical protein
MAQYKFIDEGKSAAGQRTFPISQATRERLARTKGIATKPVSAVRISATAFDHAVGTMRVQA